VSCPSTSLCVATGLVTGTVAITPTVVTSTDPTSGASAWTATTGFFNGTMTSLLVPCNQPVRRGKRSGRAELDEPHRRRRRMEEHGQADHRN
jgi:hypothetical protein